ncbi:MAG TPA: FAD-binding protein, partial [Candidatus Acidoferrales bacterium]|nr:FAD-binding protein [Candidatus Acidoferrales bacterium]
TTLPSLYAAGETASTGVHGANRLASNALLEGLVFGARAGATMAADAKPAKAKITAVGNPGPGKQGNNPGHGVASPGPSPVLEQIRTITWKDAGIIRNGRDLALALEELGALEVPRPENPSRPGCERYNLWTLARLITRAALAREESRGSHYRSDFPFHSDEHFGKHSITERGKKISFE